MLNFEYEYFMHIVTNDRKERHALQMRSSWGKDE